MTDDLDPPIELLPPQPIRMWGEFCSSGMWDAEGMSIYPDELPVPQLLRDRLAAWADWYDREEQRNDTGSPWEALGGPIDAFDAEGTALAAALRAVLGPAWDVTYFPVAAWKEA